MNEKAFSLRIPLGLYGELQSFSKKHHVTMSQLARILIRIGLIAVAENDPKLVVKNGDEIQPVYLIWP